MLLVGSKALVTHGLSFRKSRDKDYITSYDEYEAFLVNLEKLGIGFNHKPLSGNKFVIKTNHGHIVEFEIAWPGSSGEALLKELDAFDKAQVASPEVVLALKMSHRYLKNSPHFKKTMEDILELRGLGYQIPESLQGWFKKREQETYDYKHPKLAQGKDSFFSGDGVPYIYDHDTLHLAIKQGTCPAYMYFQTAEIFCSKELFDSCGPSTRINSVLEESYVLALERSQIPNDFKISPRRSFLKALEKVCTSIASGWWREFAWEHYYQVLGRYSDNYVQKFHTAQENGLILPYKKD